MDVSIFLLLSLYVFSVHSFTYKECDDSSGAIQIKDLSVSPSPVASPGNLTLSGQVILKTDVTGHLQVSLNIKKKVFFFWITAPCISHYGSCTYDDICEHLDHHFSRHGRTHCHAPFTLMNMGCTCPIKAGSYILPPILIPIPDIYSILLGDYKVEVRLSDKTSDKVLGCYNMEFSISRSKPKQCSGFFDCL